MFCPCVHKFNYLCKEVYVVEARKLKPFYCTLSVMSVQVVSHHNTRIVFGFFASSWQECLAGSPHKYLLLWLSEESRVSLGVVSRSDLKCYDL